MAKSYAQRTSELYTVKGYAVIYDRTLDRDRSRWGNAEMYAIFPTKAEAMKWLGDNQLDRSVRCKITYPHKSPIRKKKRKKAK